MAAPPTLPEPVLDCPAEECLRCGYALRGLAAPGPCPECGLEFDASAMVLCGVASAAGLKLNGRTLAWGIIAAATVLYSQALGLLFLFRPVMGLVLTLALASAIVVMLLTRRHDRRGQERFVFSGRGIACLPLRAGDEGAARVLIAWPPGATVTVRRVSPFWREVRVRGEAGWVFRAGVRCPDEFAGAVEARLGELAGGGRWPLSGVDQADPGTS